MATLKLLFFSVFFILRFASISSHNSHLEPEDAISSLKIKLEQLKMKVSILESTNEKNNHELKSKDDDIPERENIILEISESMASLQDKIETLQLQKASYEQKTGVHKTVQDLQVADEEMVKVGPVATFMKTVKSSIVAHWKKFWRPAMDASFQKILVKLSLVLRDGETCIETLKTEWIPVMMDKWLTFITSLSPHFKSLTAKAVETYHLTKNSLLSHTVVVQQAAAPFIQEWIPVMKDKWLTFITFLGPHFEFLTAKAIETYHMTKNSLLSHTVEVQQAAAPFIQEWIPVMKDQWLTFITSLGPHFESLTAKAVETYHLTKNSLLSHTVEVQQAEAPFTQQAQELAEPYISQVETVAKPYAREPVHAYRMFIASAISYHKQVQQMLKTNELTRSLASMEVAWFVATALLCLPVVFLCRLGSAIFRKKATRKLGRASDSYHSRRKLKRHRNID